MLDLDYIRWTDYYQNVCLPYYKSLKANLADYNYSDELFNQFIQFFDSCFDLMKYYVWNNGEFYFNRYAIFRNFYRQGYIDDGDSWMILNHMIKQNIDKKEILEFALLKNFKIFDDFIEKIKNIPETEKSYLNQPQKDVLKENIENFSSYIRIICYDSYYSRFNELNEKYSKGLLKEEDYWNFLCAIEGVIAYYWRYIKKYYKYLHSIALNNPVQGYTRARQDGFINDADCWLEYIEDWNAYLNINDETLKKQKLKEIIDYYRSKVINTYIKVHSNSDKETEEKYNFIKDDDIKKYITPDENTIEYKAETLGLSEYSYNILMDFFKNNTEIKNVWLYGSRARGENSKSSDLDMVADCSYGYIKEINNELQELPIPYYCDLHTMDDYENKIFLISAIKDGIKKIYSSADFQSNTENSTYSYNNYNLQAHQIAVNLIRQDLKKQPNYPTWEFFYRQTWLDNFIYTGKMISNKLPADEIFDNFLSLFNNTCDLLKLFAYNNGVYIKNTNTIIKYLYQINCINNLEQWLDFIKTVFLYKDKNTEKPDLNFITKNYKLLKELKSFLDRQL